MNKLRYFVLLTGALLVSGGNAQGLPSNHWNTLERYCSKCHNTDDFAGGFAIDQLNHGDLHPDAALWEKVVRKLRSGMMPPPGEERPATTGIAKVVSGLEAALDKTAARHPNPGAVVLHRMNRNEYANAVRDLLALPVNGEHLLPADDSAAGFDNIASTLVLSPALMQSYITAASRISRLAVGDMGSSPALTSFQPPAGMSQSVHIDGLPLGTRGGIRVEHVFPLDAEYEFNIRRSGANNFALPVVGTRDPIEVAIDGERVALIEADKPTRIRLPVKAGSHVVQIAFLHTAAEQAVNDLFAVHAQSVSVGGFDLRGPYNPQGVGDTASRRKIFVCYPKQASEQAACAREIISKLATRAWRGPVTEAALNDLLGFYGQGAELRDFDTGVQYALARILSDPRFVYRFEKEPDKIKVGDSYAIDGHELASRLSFFLWSSIPDDELLRAAGAGELRQAKKLEQQIDRMLADPRADALVQNFAEQWLGLRQLATINPTSTDYDGTLRESMRRETQLLFSSILRENRSVLDLLNADYTFVDGRLARHYGIAQIQGSQFRRVPVSDANRRGILGHASVLTLTSAPNRTSLVKRGQWVLENLLGTPPSPPPPGVEANLDQPPLPGAAPATVRQRMEQHRANPSCAACHGVIDPIGIALENFDAIGKWRDASAGQPVDAVTALWDGTPLNGAADLRKALEARSPQFAETVAEKLLTYGLGRKVEYYDMPTVRSIVSNAKARNYKFKDLIKGVALSSAFQRRVKQPTTKGQFVVQEH
jgi:mono/diheme cytochrome c family protein